VEYNLQALSLATSLCATDIPAAGMPLNFKRYL